MEKVNSDPYSTWVAGASGNNGEEDWDEKIRALGTVVYDDAPMVCVCVCVCVCIRVCVCVLSQ